jgi:hypothetical protein
MEDEYDSEFNASGQKHLSLDKRHSRNQNEKKRRDQFNDLIDNLAYLLNQQERKSDKSTTLLEALNFLKAHSANGQSGLCGF